MEYWERELIQALLEMPPAGACDLATLAKRSGIATADIIEALAQPGCRFEELRIVAWKRTGCAPLWPDDVCARSCERAPLRSLRTPA